MILLGQYKRYANVFYQVKCLLYFRISRTMHKNLDQRNEMGYLKFKIY